MTLAAKDAAAEQASALALPSAENEEVIKQPTSLLRRILPALLCVFTDYYGLSAMVPMMPFHLQDAAGLDNEAATMYFGIINSSQYAGVVVGCIFWGFASDRLGPMRSVQMTMIGDVVTFALTGITVQPGYLIVVRIAAGFFSPLVPGSCTAPRRSPHILCCLLRLSMLALPLMHGCNHRRIRPVRVPFASCLVLVRGMPGGRRRLCSELQLPRHPRRLWRRHGQRGVI